MPAARSLRRSACVFFVVPLLALGAGSARAAHPLVTEDTGTQGQGRWQLEVNAERTRDRADGAVTRGTQPAATLSYGAWDTVDLQITQAWLRERTDGIVASGRLDTALDLKWRVYENGPLSLALKPGMTLPTGRDEEGRGAGRSTWGGLAVVSYERERWAAHAHAGYRRNRNTLGERESLRQLAGAIVLKPSERLKLALDHARETNPEQGSGASLRQTVLGAIYAVTRDLDIDAGLRRGNDPAIDRALMVGMALRW